MDKVFRWIFGIGGLVMLLLAVLWGVSKLVGPSRAERAALAVVSQPWQAAGRNAYADLWLADHDVPAAERQRVMAADVAAFAAHPLGSDAGKPAVIVPGRGRFPSDQPDAQSRRRLCGVDEDCLAKVRADMPAYGSLVATHAAWFARHAEASGGDHLRNAFPPRLDMPMPAFAKTYAPATALALQFAQGAREAALARTCGQVADWRRLGAHSDMLVGWAVAHAYAGRGYARLLAQMLAEWPVDAPLPAACEAAMALPDADETTMCPVMRGEFRYMSEGVTAISDAEQHRNGLKTRLLFDREMTRAQMAPEIARFCGESADAAFARDALPAPVASPGLYRLQCVSNAVGCILAQVAGPGFDGYADRHRDYLAAMRGLAVLSWLRAHSGAGATPEARLQRLPPVYRAAAHPMAFDAGRDALVIDMLDTHRPELVLPLPASRIPATR